MQPYDVPQKQNQDDWHTACISAVPVEQLSAPPGSGGDPHVSKGSCRQVWWSSASVPWESQVSPDVSYSSMVVLVGQMLCAAQMCSCLENAAASRRPLCTSENQLTTPPLQEQSSMGGPLGAEFRSLLP